MSPAMISFVLKKRRKYRILLAFLLGIPAVAVIVLSAASLHPVGTAAGVLGTFAAIGALLLTQCEIPANRDLRESSYLRADGPVLSIRSVSRSWWLVRISGQKLYTQDEEPVRILQRLRWASVDYTRHLNVIFAIRDESGCTVFAPLDRTSDDVSSFECRQCGALNPPDFKFCGECGAPIARIGAGICS